MQSFSKQQNLIVEKNQKLFDSLSTGEVLDILRYLEKEYVLRAEKEIFEQAKIKMIAKMKKIEND